MRADLNYFRSCFDDFLTCQPVSVVVTDELHGRIDHPQSHVESRPLPRLQALTRDVEEVLHAGTGLLHWITAGGREETSPLTARKDR